MDYLALKDLPVSCNIGVSKEEKKRKQMLLISVLLFLDLKKACKSDKLEDTINYSEVNEKIREKTQKEEYNMIEHLAEEIAILLLSVYPLKKIRVVIKKTEACKGKGYPLVYIERHHD
ncbi:dihydroneopterin aldolase [Candidatus Woesearchaeota archaeon]|nr:dihydroneopterin aldolase [Candidatus Woesearchaeota archaeon]